MQKERAQKARSFIMAAGNGRGNSRAGATLFLRRLIFAPELSYASAFLSVLGSVLAPEQRNQITGFFRPMPNAG